MNGLTLFLIAVALAMDACAVSISAGATLKKDIAFYGVRAALFFGIFQGGMPIIGYLIGEAGSEVIAPYDHWVAFILLSVIGGKMCYESLKGGECEREAGVVSLPTLTLLAVATSIDALAVGVTFALLETPIVTAALVIGVVTFFASLAGVWAGRRFGCYLGEKVEVIGGIILIGIGVKILMEGVFF
ncbi:MAG: manganese efflux pump MntP family protein [Methanocalculus sp.]|uniref:manganese efflux pump MntP n=1 Tax=Methanocalculus sp. TaxID=2004547 RepID=UPI002720AD2B|nr:manganese efflux pump MntP family protein [Methanocalculus sp.]MDO9539195.1 manganese efflux pump MntP family protein [Methanocalculus sp.]